MFANIISGPPPVTRLRSFIIHVHLCSMVYLVVGQSDRIRQDPVPQHQPDPFGSSSNLKGNEYLYVTNLIILIAFHPLFVPDPVIHDYLDHIAPLD